MILAARTLGIEERRNHLMMSDYSPCRSNYDDTWEVIGCSGIVSGGFETKEGAEAEILWNLLDDKGLI